MLLPSMGANLSPFQIANILKGSGVGELDILGCSGTSIAAKLSLLAPDVRVGYLGGKREDDIEVDPSTFRVKALTIEPQTLRHFGGKR